ncbi:NAD(P)-binding protein [Auriculariales sp. MPI-PUGE-AT-0066]|nr:NAD(P)-binding protein [Auriculariales sp. MPI-PUGE-AT-0066]
MATFSHFNETTTGDEVVSAFSNEVAGRVFLITGPTTGSIGAFTAVALAKGKPSCIILAGRAPERFQDVVNEIRSLDANINVFSVILDLASFASVRNAANKILQNAEIPRLDVLINNAAIMAQPFHLTSDGIESQFQVNHLGHFLLTNLLLPKLKLSEKPTVINVSSGGHRFAHWDYNDYNWEKRPYNVWQGYGQGKAGNVLLSVSLAQRGIYSLSLNPGRTEGTQLGAHLTMDNINDLMAVMAITENMEPMILKNTAQGAATTLVAALDPNVPNGNYLNECQVYPAHSRATDPELAQTLWDLSNKLTGEKFV